MKLYQLFFIALASFSIYSCSKKTESKEPLAEIQFTSPEVNKAYLSSDSISITGTIKVTATAPAGQTLHGYDVIVRKYGDTTQLFFKHIHGHGTLLNFNEKWLNASGNSNFETEIKTYTDHDGSYVSKTIRFQSN